MERRSGSGLKVGDRCGRLVLARPVRVGGQRAWVCRCDCGTVRAFVRYNLLSGNSRSCGCARIEYSKAQKNRLTHGMTGSAEFRIWSGMKVRCNDPLNPVYGSRGVKVCRRWALSFEAFYADVGPRPGHYYSLERVENDKGYEPGNVVWALPKAQANNRRSCRVLEVDGIRKTMAQWSDERGIKPSTIGMRLRRGWTPAEAVSVVVPS